MGLSYGAIGYEVLSVIWWFGMAYCVECNGMLPNWNIHRKRNCPNCDIIDA